MLFYRPDRGAINDRIAVACETLFLSAFLEQSLNNCEPFASVSRHHHVMRNRHPVTVEVMGSNPIGDASWHGTQTGKAAKLKPW
jgi:hypothetical protein